MNRAYPTWARPIHDAKGRVHTCQAGVDNSVNHVVQRTHLRTRQALQHKLALRQRPPHPKHGATCQLASLRGSLQQRNTFLLNPKIRQQMRDGSRCHGDDNVSRAANGEQERERTKRRRANIHAVRMLHSTSSSRPMRRSICDNETLTFFNLGLTRI
eukprot:4602872-Pleurochrysis_carterae.AAC.2